MLKLPKLLQYRDGVGGFTGGNFRSSFFCKTRESLLASLFALSGVAALIYQVCWQRLLFSAFGVDIDSITIIVSAFMLGLGVGALVGGRLADRFPSRIILFFTIFEAGIGIFGLCSPHLIAWTASRMIQADHLSVAVANFCLMLFPTILMGATLPMLVVYLNRVRNNVGVSIGQLYLFNTFGAAYGSFLVGFVLFMHLTINQSIYLAAAINFSVAVLVKRAVLERENP